MSCHLFTLSSGFRAVFFLFLVLAIGCGGGGSGSEAVFSGPTEGITLLTVTYPKQADLSGAQAAPIESAPLSQQVVFTFSGPVQAPVTAEGIQIVADPGPDYAGPLAALDESSMLIRARGTFEVLGSSVVFNPFIPIGEIDLKPNADPNRVPGFLPGYTYSVFVPLGTKGSISNLKNVGSGVSNPGSFTTLSPSAPSMAFSNIPHLPPKVLSTDPPDGTVDFPLNHFSDPGKSDILIQFDQPLDASTDNLEGKDLDGDGLRDPNFFLGYSEPVLYSAVDKGTTQLGLIARVDGVTDDFELVGYTQYQGTNLGLKSIVFQRSSPGEEPFPMVGCTGTHLYDVDYKNPGGNPPVVELTNERGFSGGAMVKGLALTRNGDVFGLDDAGGSLLKVDLASGDVEVKGALPPGAGEFVDLCTGPDNKLYGLRVLGPGTPSAVASIEQINRNKLTSKVVATGLAGDFSSIGFTRAHTVVLFDADQLQRIVLDLTTGTVLEYGLKIIDPNLQAGSRLDFDMKRYEVEVNPILEMNAYNGSKVRLKPSGLLPFGAWFDVMVRHSLKNINGASKSSLHGKNALGAGAAATIKTLDLGSGVIADIFLEDFLDNELEDKEHEFAEARALWNVADPNATPPHYEHLLAALGQTGGGELGDFLPTGLYPLVILDTDYQAFPLLDGSTPDILVPTEVYGGEFHFHDIVIPEFVTVMGMGSNPLVLTATGRVEIAGTIDVSGEDGEDDMCFNCGVTPTAGGAAGPGGGRGGMGQPPIPPDFTKYLDLQSPPSGERGWGPGNLAQTGGRGGESGAQGPEVPWKGSAQDPKSRGAGGGGGTFLQEGHQGYPGKGRYGVDENGYFYEREPWDYWDGSYKYVPGWDPSHGPPPEDWKINQWFAAEDHRHPHPGDGGDAVFTDADPDNDFIGANGELKHLRGGQGGGGGGSRLDSMNPEAQMWAGMLIPPMPPCMADARGGGGGGAGGAVAIHCLGEIVVKETGRILARGGRGGGAEVIGNSQFGGAGGGGSGGAIILNSAERIFIEHTDVDHYGHLDVSGGRGADAKQNVSVSYTPVLEPCAVIPHTGQLKNKLFCSFTRGDGGYGGHGIIQLMVPDPFDPQQLDLHVDSIMATVMQIDQLPNWPKTKGETGYSYYHFDLLGSSPDYWYTFPTTTDCLVPPDKTPTSINPLSFAVSKWINMGMAITRPEVGGKSPPLLIDFEGVVPAGDWAVVATQNGHVKNAHIPGFNDIIVDAPDLGLKDYINDDNEVALQFQGTDAVAPGSKVPNEDPAVVSDWTWDLASLGGRQFVRFRVRLDTAKGSSVTPMSYKPQVNMVRVRMEY